MDDGEVGVRGGEHGGEAGRRQRARLHRVLGGLESKLDGGGGPAPFIDWQGRRHMRCQWLRIERSLATQHRTRLAPRWQPGRGQAHGLDEHRGHVASPNNRLQLLPPKPNELLSTRRTGASRFSSRIAAWISGSRLRVLRLAGMKPCSMHSRLTAASTIPAAPSVWPVQPLVELQGRELPKT